MPYFIVEYQQSGFGRLAVSNAPGYPSQLADREAFELHARGLSQRRGRATQVVKLAPDVDPVQWVAKRNEHTLRVYVDNTTPGYVAGALAELGIPLTPSLRHTAPEAILPEGRVRFVATMTPAQLTQFRATLGQGHLSRVTRVGEQGKGGRLRRREYGALPPEQRRGWQALAGLSDELPGEDTSPDESPAILGDDDDSGSIL